MCYYPFLFLSCRLASPAKLGDFEEELSRGGGLADVPLIAAVTLAVVEGKSFLYMAGLPEGAWRTCRSLQR